ncbi:MAG: DUF4364 family protein [Clostridia bacterium]|nr:DUF4364 family protein [Clostridia bacterium]
MFDVHATEEEDRLVLLCALNRLGGCTEEQLLRFVVETGLQSQFRFYLALASLKEAEQVRIVRHLEGMLLVLTPQGRQSMEMFASRIRASQMEKLERYGKQWRGRVREELAMPADFVKSGNGYAVTLRALESGEEIFSMTLTAADKAQAKQFCARWPKSAPYLYQTIMAQLGEKQEEEQKNTDA